MLSENLPSNFHRGFTPSPNPARRVRLMIDGRPAEAAAGELLIEVAGRLGIEIPSFCYYSGLSVMGACRMCLVEIEKMARLQTACSTAVIEGMVVRTDTAQVRQARKSMLEFVLTNHPLDCPVCDKGGECELQDSTFRYGAGEGRFIEIKQHFDEQQWSPVVFFDRPRCILCYRCVRVCEEGMGVGALTVIGRACPSSIAPNLGDHLECDECGMCIDICPVGALTSGEYRYKTRPWEMAHTGTICAHCADGCRTTLGIRLNQVMRGNNRDRSGLNGDFLCIKGRYAGDFVQHPDRLHTPLVRKGGQLVESSWTEAIHAVAQRFLDIRSSGGKFGVIGSTRTTNEDNFVLRTFAREILGTGHLDHRRSGDVVGLLSALEGRPEALARIKDLYTGRAILIIGADLAHQHPMLSYQIRANWRHHRCAVYSVTLGPVREDMYATESIRAPRGQELSAVYGLSTRLKNEQDLVIVFGDSIRGNLVRELVSWGDSLGIPVKYVCLVDDCNSRGAVDMGVLPTPGGWTIREMLASPELDALWIIGANTLKQEPLAAGHAFVVVQDLFLTKTASHADVVLPASSAYEKGGTMTNVCGEVQRLERAVQVEGTKPDLNIFQMIATAMKVPLRAANYAAVWDDISKSVPGYQIPRSKLTAENACSTTPGVPDDCAWDSSSVRSREDTIFTSGTLGRYCATLGAVLESPSGLYRWPHY